MSSAITFAPSVISGAAKRLFSKPKSSMISSLMTRFMTSAHFFIIVIDYRLAYITGVVPTDVSVTNIFIAVIVAGIYIRHIGKLQDAG